MNKSLALVLMSMVSMLVEASSSSCTVSSSTTTTSSSTTSYPVYTGTTIGTYVYETSSESHSLCDVVPEETELVEGGYYAYSIGSCDNCRIYIPSTMVVPEHNLNLTFPCFSTTNLTSSLFCDCSGGGDECTVGGSGSTSIAESPYSKAKSVNYLFHKMVRVERGLVESLCSFTYTYQRQLGVLQLKIGKINEKNSTIKVSASITDLKSKKVIAPAVTVVLNSDYSFTTELTFRNSAKLTITGNSQGKLSLTFDSSFDYAVYEAQIGGVLNPADVVFGFSGDPSIALPAGFGYVLDESNWQVSCVIKNGSKFQFPKTSTPKILQSGSSYSIAGLEGENVRGVSLSYSKNTGFVKGKYMVYSSDINNASGKPKLIKTKMTIAGVVYDGTCQGAIFQPDGTQCGEFQIIQNQ